MSTKVSAQDPFDKFRRWQEKVRKTGNVDLSEAACLSTVDPEGWPDGRMVLVKKVGPDGFFFYTNLESPKARHLASAPRAALTFYWDDLGRQIRAQGSVEPLSEAESDAYFSTRPRLSQLGAWASDQSRVLSNRAVLLARVAQTTLKFLNKPVARPPHWGGFRLKPRWIEFWRRRTYRLHDRFLYKLDEKGGWSLSRLYP